MALTEFGKIIRKARIDAGVTAVSMGKSIGVSQSFISSVERGSRRIPSRLAIKVEKYFYENFGISNLGLKRLAEISNGYIDISNLSFEHKELLAKLAQAPLNQEQIDSISNFLIENIYKGIKL